MLTYPNIDPVILNFSFIKIHWYGVMYLVGFGAAWILGNIRCNNSKGIWNKTELSDLIFYAAIGVIIGGRLGYVFFYDFSYFLKNPLWLFKVWEGGMSFHGGLLGVLISIWIFSKKYEKSFFQTTDFIAPLVPIGLGAGRLGNFIGSELWGRASTVPWAMIFPNDSRQITRHPSQIYQFFVEGIVLFVFLWFFSKKKRPQASVSGLFLLLYGIGRFIVEFFRQPDTQIGFVAFECLTMGQILSFPMIIIGIYLMFYGYKKKLFLTSFNSKKMLNQ